MLQELHDDDFKVFDAEYVDVCDALDSPCVTSDSQRLKRLKREILRAIRDLKTENEVCLTLGKRFGNLLKPLVLFSNHTFRHEPGYMSAGERRGEVAVFTVCI
jgi:hypothetical protein